MLRDNLKDESLRKDIYDTLNILKDIFPNASCELIYHNLYELVCAVMLSAQTSDQMVNKVTKDLFIKYPTFLSLKQANRSDIEEIIKPLGLSKVKSSNLIKLGEVMTLKYNQVVPDTMEELCTLPGIGRKCANVILSEGYHKEGLAVDTHVLRVSKRLGFVADKATPLDTEYILKANIDGKDYHDCHHLLLFFGRYLCLAKNPKCNTCSLKDKCKIYKE